MNYADIKKFDIVNGTGCRVSLFVTGCPHHCKGCFNQSLWDYAEGTLFEEVTIKKILDLCSPEYISGLSILGGEPLAPENRPAVEALCHRFKQIYPSKSIWLWTGYLWEEVSGLMVMQYIDVLVDGPFIESQRDPSLFFRGSRNQRIIDVAKSLADGSLSEKITY